jgi:hypothetical protein
MGPITWPDTPSNALKACIARLTSQDDYPPKPRFIHDYYSHEIERLVKIAGLTAQRDADAAAVPDLAANWAVVKDWTEESRYERRTQAQAQQLIAAIADAAHVVLPWIKRRWKTTRSMTWPNWSTSSGGTLST